MKTGIYMIRNKANDKKYIGQAFDIDQRWRAHTNKLKRNGHYNKYLQRSWNKYGEENFEFSIICECEVEKLNELEIYYINRFDTFKNGYNLTLGGEGTRGYKYSDEQMQWRHTDEHRAKMSEASKKMWADPARRAKITGDKNVSKRLDVRIKLSKANKGENNPMYGKKHSEETRKKISEAHKGRKLSEEHKAKLSEIEKGEGNPMYGKRHSEETKAILSEKQSKPIYCVTNFTIYASGKEMAQKLNIPRSTIAYICKNNHIHNKSGIEFWYLDEWDKISGYIKEGE